MLFLLENLNGYALVEKISNDKNMVTNTEDLNLRSLYKYKTRKEALKSTEKLIQGKFTKNLKKFLLNNVRKEDSLIVGDTKLKIEINKNLGHKFCLNIEVKSNFREIREYFVKIWETNNPCINKDNIISISHLIYSRKLKITGSKIDTMIIYANKIFDEIEKEINFFSIRLREWYSWHFPELCNLVRDNLVYAKLISKIETRVHLKSVDISDIVDSETANKIRELSELSLGSDFSSDDLESVLCLSTQIISLSCFKEILKNYIKSRMYTVAPNLTATVGERIGAKLISHVGSLVNLSKYPASTIQIFGAEKALFRAKKDKKPTPKFGIIYNSSIVTIASNKNKGKIGRMVSGKIALSARMDALGELKQGGSLGLKNKIKIEQRLKQLESFERKI
nr:SAR DNA-binding protein-1 [Cryptomonas sp.]